MKLFLPQPGLAPRKRFRGMRRYYRSLEERAATYRIDTDADMWWNYWHEHMDFRGWGNLGWRHRRAHLIAHFRVLERIQKQLVTFPGPYQLWLRVSAGNACDDSVYVHSPNPHAEFPVVLGGVEWNVGVPSELGAIAPSGLVWGSDADGELCAFAPGVGVDLRG